MKKIVFLASLAIFSAAICQAQTKENCLPLFNGKDLTNWNLQKPGAFEVVNGELITRSSGTGTDIFTSRRYSNFILELEFFLSEVGNSGVFIRQDPTVPGSGFEVQLLAPWTPWRDDLHCTGSLYGHVAVTDRPDETTGRWYKMEIKCDRNEVAVSVNGKVTTRADIDTVKTMAGKPWSGFIGFQGNHAEKEEQYAKFRNICIRDLDAEPEYVITGFKSENELLRGYAMKSAVDLGAPVVSMLAAGMSDDNPMVQSLSKQALFDIAALASDPDEPASVKNGIKVELTASLNAATNEITKDYLKWLTGMISDGKRVD